MRTDEELMEAYCAGDTGAFRELFRRFAPVLLRMLARGLSRREDADDLVQQCFLQLHRSRADFRPGAKLRPWLFAIAMNVKREHLRRLGRRPETALDEPSVPACSTDADPERMVRARQLGQALDKLAPNQREVLELHYFDGLSFPEIADVLGAGLSAVKVRAHRAYEQLRELMGEPQVTDPANAPYKHEDKSR